MHGSKRIDGKSVCSETMGLKEEKKKVGAAVVVVHAKTMSSRVVESGFERMDFEYGWPWYISATSSD